MAEWTELENEIVKANIKQKAQQIKEILKENGFDRELGQIIGRKNKLNKVLNKPKTQKTKFFIEKIDFIIQKIGEGLSFSTIAKMLKVNSTQLTYFIKRNPLSKEKFFEIRKKYYSKRELNIVEAEGDKSNVSIQKVLSENGFQRDFLEISYLKLQLSDNKDFKKGGGYVMKKIQPHEKEIVRMLDNGLSVKYISHELGVNRMQLRRYMFDNMKLDLSKYELASKPKPIEKTENQTQETQTPIIYAYIRVSTEGQTVENQRHELIPFAKSKGYVIEEWFEETISGAKEIHKREINNLILKVKKGDILFVAELSRLSRRLVDILSILEKFTKKGVSLYTKKENFELNNSILSTIMASIFGIFAQLERDLIAQRTKEGLNRRMDLGMKVGRPKSTPKSKIVISECLKYEKEIQELLDKGVPVIQIAKAINLNRGSVVTYLKNKANGVKMATKEQRAVMISEQNIEYGKSILSEKMPDFVVGDLGYLISNRSKFIEFKNIGFSYKDLAGILGIDAETLRTIMK